MSWKNFSITPISSNEQELSCKLCGNADLRVREVPPQRSGGHYSCEVVATCLNHPEPNHFRVKLGRFKEGEAKYVMRRV